SHCVLLCGFRTCRLRCRTVIRQFHHAVAHHRQCLDEVLFQLGEFIQHVLVSIGDDIFSFQTSLLNNVGSAVVGSLHAHFLIEQFLALLSGQLHHTRSLFVRLCQNSVTGGQDAR